MSSIFSRRNFLKNIGLGTVALTFNRLYADSPAEKPNIVIILADDMGWSDIGCYGGEISTPNLDHLGENGIRFTQMHNASKCFPSRAILLTGVYAQQCGMDKGPGNFKNSVNFGQVLKSSGYRTLFFGKHHSKDNPFDFGFDHYYGLRDGAANYFNPGLQREGESVPGQKRPGKRVWCFDDKVLQPYTPKEKDFYSTDYFTKWAMDFLDKYKKEKNPFVLYLSYQAPHDPLQAWPDDIKKYQGKYMNGYNIIRKERYKKMKQMGLIDDSFPLSNAMHEDWESLSQDEKEDQDLRMAVYAAMIECMDRNIGKLIKKLKKLGKYDNTLILFASDNGCSPEVVKRGKGKIGSASRWSSLGANWANVSNTPFRYYKNNSYQGGICTPFIAYSPTIVKNGGRISHRRGHFIDIMATLVDITKANYPSQYKGQNVTPLQGESFLPVLRGKEVKRKKPIFYSWARGKAVMQDKWKLVSNKNIWELYDMEKDKTETKNLIKKYPEIVTRLKKLWTDWTISVKKVSK